MTFSEGRSVLLKEICGGYVRKQRNRRSTRQKNLKHHAPRVCQTQSRTPEGRNLSSTGFALLCSTTKHPAIRSHGESILAGSDHPLARRASEGLLFVLTGNKIPRLRVGLTFRRIFLR